MGIGIGAINPRAFSPRERDALDRALRASGRDDRERRIREEVTRVEQAVKALRAALDQEAGEDMPDEPSQPHVS